MKRTFALLAFLMLFAFGARGQTTFSTGGAITAGGADCSTATRCISIQLPTNAATLSVTVSGTFSATLTLEQSGDNGGNWATFTTTSATGLTIVPVGAITNFRVRCSSYSSGIANVNLQASVASSVVSSVGVNVNSNLRAATTYPTAAADGASVQAMGDKAGRTVTVLNAPRNLVTPFSVQTTDTSGHTLIAAGATGVFNDIGWLVITNETATATVVSLSDGTTTYKFALAASGGGAFMLPMPLNATSSATAWTVTSSANVTLDFVGEYIANK